MIKLTCDTCGKSIEKQPSAVHEHNFCGRECFAKWRSSSDWTGANNPSWLGGHSEYRGENWSRQRSAARERDNDTCQRCGVNGHSFPVHHIRPFHLFDTYLDANRLENLVTLCPPCHGLTEAEFWQSNPNLADGRKFPLCFVTRTCDKCGLEFRTRAGAAKLCDDCKSVTCEHCGKSFVNDRIRRDARFCSKQCRADYLLAHSTKHRERVCEACGKTFTSLHSTARFCSKTCYLTRANPRRAFFARRNSSAQE